MGPMTAPHTASSSLRCLALSQIRWPPTYRWPPLFATIPSKPALARSSNHCCARPRSVVCGESDRGGDHTLPAASAGPTTAGRWRPVRRRLKRQGRRSSPEGPGPVPAVFPSLLTAAAAGLRSTASPRTTPLLRRRQRNRRNHFDRRGLDFREVSILLGPRGLSRTSHFYIATSVWDSNYRCVGHVPHVASSSILGMKSRG